MSSQWRNLPCIDQDNVKYSKKVSVAQHYYIKQTDKKDKQIDKKSSHALHYYIKELDNILPLSVQL